MPEGQEAVEGGQDGGQEPGGSPGQGGGTPQSWEEVLASLPQEQQALYQKDVEGLRSALETERGERKELAKQLQKASEQLEEGSELRQELEQTAARIEEAERRASFYEEAVGQGVSNPKLAFVAAQEIEAFDKRGNVNWGAIKEAFPELFRKSAPPPGNAGAGTGGQPAGGLDMDQIIRAAAGRK